MLTYSTYVSQLANLTVYASSDTTFTTAVPGAIDYAEQRMYRELDLLVTRQTDASGACTVNSRSFTLPTTIGNFLVVEELNIITPATATAATGTRNPVQFVSKQFLDAVYPNQTSGTGVPQFAAMLNNTTVIFGPAPDANYPVEVIGTQFPAPLSSTNTSTFLTQYLPDVFIAASMIYMSGFMRDFGAQSDNPQMAQSWEGQYDKLMQSASTLEFRKMYQSQAWTSNQPNPVATPSRV